MGCEMFSVIHEGMNRPFRSPTSRGAFKIARSFQLQGKAGVRILDPQGETMPMTQSDVAALTDDCSFAVADEAIAATGQDENQLRN